MPVLECKDLDNMLKSLSGTAKLEDNDSDGFIDFGINRIGEVFINGQLGGTFEDNYLKYKFSTDKIAIAQFICELKRLLSYVDN
jgi:hypothetical protein